MTRLPRAALAVALLVGSRIASGQVTTSQYDNARTGANTREVVLTPANVNAASFGKVATLHVDGDVYAQPLYLPAVSIAGRGKRAVVYVATEHNSLYAFDATGGTEPLWRVELGGPDGGTSIPSREVSCPFIRPEVGITPTPVIDTTTGTLFVLARTRESGRYVQRLHAIDIASGNPKHQPVEIRASVKGGGAGSVGGLVTFDPLRENPRAGLLLVNGRVILTWASSCDVGPYHGWVMAYDAKTLEQRAVFNTTPDGGEGGVWQADAAPAADAQGRIFLSTGNGSFDASSGGRNFGDTVLEMLMEASGFVVRDYFTPFNQKLLEQRDGDLGSGGPLLIPDQPGPHKHLLLTGGKGGDVYLLDRDSLGKFNPARDASVVQIMRSPGMVMSAASYWNDHVFTLWSEDRVKSFALANGRLSQSSEGSQLFHDPGATPTISANGVRDGIMWIVETKTWNGSDKPAVLHAFDALHLDRELYSSESNARRDRAGQATRFAIPTVAGGRVYVGAKSEVDVYGLLTSAGKN